MVQAVVWLVMCVSVFVVVAAVFAALDVWIAWRDGDVVELVDEE